MNGFAAKKVKKEIPPKKMRDWIVEMNVGKLHFLGFK